MDVPTYHKVLIVTDAAINIAPTLEDKVDIVQNAIDLAGSFAVLATHAPRTSLR
jgi:phosphotransacetylase